MKTAEYDGWFRDPRKLIRNIVANRGFDREFDYMPYQEYDINGQHRFHDLFSGNWCWRQAVSFHPVNSLSQIKIIIFRTPSQKTPTHMVL